MTSSADISPAPRMTSRGFPYGHWTVKANVLASAKAFKGIPPWRRACPGAYTAARQRGWLDEAVAHMSLNTVWTADMLLADAARYASRSAWKAASASAYRTASDRKMLERCCAGMQRLHALPGERTRESCLESASRFQTIVEWTQQDGGAVDAAFRQGWYSDCVDHMIEIMSFGEYCIRRFLMSHDIEFKCEKTFPDLKVKRSLRYDFWLPAWKLLIEYHGEQHFVERSPDESRQPLETIQEYDAIKVAYAERKGIELLVLAASKVADIEAGVAAKLDELSQRSGGSLRVGQRHDLQPGELKRLATYGRWTHEAVLAAALTYSSYGEWTGSSSYQVAHKRGWLLEASAHMTPSTKGPGWTFERLEADARLYQTRKQWQKGSSSAYQAARRQEIMEQVAPHLVPLRKRWSLEACRTSASAYATRKAWALGQGGAYNAALKNSWLDECCKHMEWNSTKPQTKRPANALKSPAALS